MTRSGIKETVTNEMAAEETRVQERFGQIVRISPADGEGWMAWRPGHDAETMDAGYYFLMFGPSAKGRRRRGMSTTAFGPFASPVSARFLKASARALGLLAPASADTAQAARPCAFPGSGRDDRRPLTEALHWAA